MNKRLKEDNKKSFSYHKKVKKNNEKFKSLIINQENIKSKTNSNDENTLINDSSSKKSIKDKFKEGLHLINKNGVYLTEYYEKNELKINGDKEETQLKNEKLFRKGFISKLLLNSKNESSSYKLSLSRKKTRLAQHIHTQYLFNCRVQAFLSMITILTSILEYENTVLTVGEEKVIHTFEPYHSKAFVYNLDEEYYNKLGKLAKICSYISLILSVFLWLSIYYDKILFYILLKGYQEKSYKIIISERKQLLRFLYSIIIFFLCPNPFTYGIEVNFKIDYYSFEYKIPLNSIFTSFLIFRIWFIFKLYLVSSDSYSQRSFRIAKINGIKLGLKYPFKANMADSSLKINISLFIICLLVFSYNLRIYERYFDELNDSNLGNYLNDLWCVFITMTTVGYGDIYPVSFFGRIITIINCMFGVFLVGLMVISVTSYLNLEGIESNIYNILLKSKKMEKRNKYAYDSIIQYLKSIKEIKNNNRNHLNKIVLSERKKINNNLNEFKIADIDFLRTIPLMNEYDNIGEHIRFLEENLNINKEKINEISELIEEVNSSFYNQ